MITIYQVLPRLFGNKTTANIQNGTLNENGSGKMNDFTDAVLSRIKQFGYSHIWYTGLIEHATQTDYSPLGIAKDHPSVVKGKAGSPYAIKDYYDIDPDLAEDVPLRMKEFENLVKRTHKAGLKMVIDFVPNHVARQYKSDAKPARTKDLGATDDTSKAFSPENNFYYIQGETLHTESFSAQSEVPYVEMPAKATGNNHFGAWPGVNDWYETIKLNYGVDYMTNTGVHFNPIPDTWKKMTHILLFWAKKGVDAFRCDMAEMVPCEFWNYAIKAVKEKYPNIIFIAEVYNPNEYRNYIYHGGFDYLYDKVGLYDTLRGVVCGYTSASNITGCWQGVDDIHTHMLNFLENHDEQRIASDFFAKDPIKARPALVVSACLNTAPLMIYAGQELGERGMDAEGFSGCDGRTTIFDYWNVPTLHRLCYEDLSTYPDSEKELYEFYKKIVQLRTESEAIRCGKFYDLMYANYIGEEGFNPSKQFAFLRKSDTETLLIICNFDSIKINVGVKIPSHAFQFMGLVEGICHGHDLISGESQTLQLKCDQHTSVEVPAYNAVILKLDNFKNKS